MTIVDSVRIEVLEGICSIPSKTYDPSFIPGISQKELDEIKEEESKLFFLCKCGEEIEGNKNTDEHKIVCPKCKRTGQVVLQQS